VESFSVCYVTAPFQAPRPSTPRLLLSYRVLPEIPPVLHSPCAPVSRRTVPLMGFVSLQRTPARRSRSTREVQLPARVRLQSFYSLDALLPFGPPRSFLIEVARGIHPSGLCSSQGSRRRFRVLEPSWPLLLPPDSR